MKVDMLPFDSFIRNNNCKQVTNPIYFNNGNIPTEDGLFSTSIFGNPGSKDRKKLFGYIDLKKPFMHPLIYNLFNRMDKKIIDCIHGTKLFIINNEGQLEENDEGSTGLDFLYENFQKLKFKDTGTLSRQEKITLLQHLKKNEVFVTKWMIIPAFLRDYNLKNGKMVVDEINKLYSKIIRLTDSLSTNSSFSFIGQNVDSNIQNLLVECYETFMSYLTGKDGYFHKALLGKSVDYATRSVISAPRFKAKKAKDMKIKFGYTGIPLSQICVLFYPFFLKYINDFFDERVKDLEKIEYKGQIITIPNAREQFSEENIKRLIELYIKSVESRFNSLTVKDSNGKEYPLNIFHNDLGRNFTITDLLYQAAFDITKDKHVYITRYPIEQYRAKRFSISF